MGSGEAADAGWARKLLWESFCFCVERLGLVGYFLQLVEVGDGDAMSVDGDGVLLNHALQAARDDLAHGAEAGSDLAVRERKRKRVSVAQVRPGLGGGFQQQGGQTLADIVEREPLG